MRVSNDQIDAIRTCGTKIDCNGCTYSTLEDCDPTKEQLAADLLEARELIKEMRNAIDIIWANSTNPAHTMTKLGLEETSDANNKLAWKMLEKSKDYA